MSLATEIAARWLADSPLTAMLAEYRDQPAIVVAEDDTLPEDVGMPCIVITGVEIDEDDGDKTLDGRDRTCTAYVFTRATGSTKLVIDIAERCRVLVHRLPDGLAPGAWMASASISLAPTGEDVYCRQIDVRVRSAA